MTLDELHELGRKDFAAAWRAALAWEREGRTPKLDWDDHGRTRYVNIPKTDKFIDLSLNRCVDTWTAVWCAMSDLERDVPLDAIESIYVGDACRGRVCEGKEA